MSRPCRMPDCRTPVGASSGGRFGLCKRCADRITGHNAVAGRDLLKPATLPPDAERSCAALGYWPDDEAGRHEIALAKRVCANCPSQTACLEVAITNREPCGIWGGQTTRERNQTVADRAVTQAWTALGQPEPGNWLACNHCNRVFDTAVSRGVHERAHSPAHNEEEPMPELDQRPEVPGWHEPAHRWEDGAGHEDQRIRQLHARVIDAIRECEEAMASWAGQAELLAEEARLIARLAELRAALHPAKPKPLKLAATGGGTTCDVCGKVCDPRGFGTHMKAHTKRGEVA